MHLHLLCIGRLKAGPEREMVCHYLARASALNRSLGLAGPDMHEIDEGKARRPADRKRDEAKALRAVLADLPGSLVIACDETGDALTSAAFAQKLGKLRDQASPSLAIVIGGPDGLDPAFAAEAQLRLAFGAMTWPHQLARIMVAEQIYRAFTMLAGHPYHRA